MLLKQTSEQLKHKTNLGLNSRVSLRPHLLDQPKNIKIFWNFL